MQAIAATEKAVPDCLSHRRGQGLRESSLGEELLPAIERFLARTREIDAVIEAAHEAEVAREQAAMAMEALATALEAPVLGVPA